MNGKLVFLSMLLVVFLAIQPAVGQPGPAGDGCDLVLVAQFQRWDDATASFLYALPGSTTETRNRLTSWLEVGMPFGESDCADVRARYFERVARVYAIMTWTTTVALLWFDPSAADYIGDLSGKSVRMTSWIRSLPPRPLWGYESGAR